MDTIAEMLVGQIGAVRAIGKFVIAPRGTKHLEEKMPKIMFAGSMFVPDDDNKALILPGTKGWCEMWECELIIMPRRKYSGYRNEEAEERRVFKGKRIDQILTGGFDRPEVWGDKYFEINSDAAIGDK